MRSRPGQRRLRAILAPVVLAMAATAAAGCAQAGPLRSVIDHLTGHKTASQTGADAQARCYGRYLVLRDAFADAIRATDAWPTAAPEAEFNRMQASFVTTLAADRGLTVRVQPDMNAADLPPDLHIAFDQGVQEAKARLAAAGVRGVPLQTVELQTGPQAMAKAQAAIDGAFAPLKTPCVRLLDARPSRDAPPSIVAQDDQTPPLPANLVPPGVPDSASNVLAVWDGPRWIQVGVSDHGDAPSLPQGAQASRDRGLRAALIRRRARHDPAPVRVAARPSPITLVSNQKAQILDAGLRGRLMQ